MRHEAVKGSIVCWHFTQDLYRGAEHILTHLRQGQRQRVRAPLREGGLRFSVLPGLRAMTCCR